MQKMLEASHSPTASMVVKKKKRPHKHKSPGNEASDGKIAVNTLLKAAPKLDIRFDDTRARA